MYSTQQNGNLYDVYFNGTKIGSGTKSYADSYLAYNPPSQSAGENKDQQYVEGTDVPLRNDQQTNPFGYGGTAENPTNTEEGLARVNAQAPQLPTRQAGESASAYATRLLNSPFFLAGSGGGSDVGSSAFVYDANSNSYVARPSSSINRPVTSAPRQNAISSNSSSGSSIDYKSYLGGSEDEAQKSAREYLDTFNAPESEADILAKKTEQAKGLIQSNKDYYAGLLAETNKVNEQRTRETNAQAVLRGLSGSSEAGSMFEKTSEVNKGATGRVLAEQAMALENIYKDIQSSAHDEFNAQKTEAYKTATDILARKEKAQTKAVSDITTLAKSGFDFDQIRLNDPVTYLHLAQSVGGEAQLKALATINRPQESIIDKRIEGGKYIIAYQNPLTGKTRIESVDLGIPAEYTKSFDLGDRLMIVPDNFNPATDKPIYVSKGLSPSNAQGTEGERQTSAFAIINKLAQPGVKDKSTGVPYISPDGYFTFDGFKTLVKTAIEDNISRDQFLAQYANLLLPGRGKEYGLTATEIKKYGI